MFFVPDVSVLSFSLLPALSSPGQNEFHSRASEPETCYGQSGNDQEKSAHDQLYRPGCFFLSWPRKGKRNRKTAKARGRIHRAGFRSSPVITCTENIRAATPPSPQVRVNRNAPAETLRGLKWSRKLVFTYSGILLTVKRGSLKRPGSAPNVKVYREYYMQGLCPRQGVLHGPTKLTDHIRFFKKGMGTEFKRCLDIVAF